MSIVFKEEIIDEIKSRTNIIDVVSKYVDIKRTGANYKGLCPFHSEKTPSFIVSEEKQIFTCFGCGATGDVIEFIKKIENLDFKDVLKKLAEECGVEIEDHVASTNQKKKELLYQLNREAALHFYKNINMAKNPGLRYMLNRGIHAATLKKFGIGYADKAWDHLYQYFTRKNIDKKILQDLGLLSYSNGKYYDKFRNRVIFPIINTRGKVIGFGGRSIDDHSIPKYLNSPESIIFQKKNNLFGLNLSRQEIQKHDSAILVEGYMDVISLYQQGVTNTVASLGTALTIQQAQMLKRYTDHVTIAYDSDEAGQAAALRAMDILYDAGCKVKIIQMKDFKDPDEYIKSNGKDAFNKLVKNAVPLIEYKLIHIKKQFDLNKTEGRVDYVKKASEILSNIKSHVEADAYIKKIAEETKISENAIKLEIHGNNKGRKTKRVRHSSEQNTLPKQRTVASDLLEKNLIKLMITRGDFVSDISPYLDVFNNESHQRIYDLITMLYKEDDEIDITKLKDSLNVDGDIDVLEDIIENIHFGGKEEQVLHDCINRIKNDRLKTRHEEIIKILQILDEEEDKNYIEQLTSEMLDIQKKLSH